MELPGSLIDRARHRISGGDGAFNHGSDMFDHPILTLFDVSHLHKTLGALDRSAVCWLSTALWMKDRVFKCDNG